MLSCRADRTRPTPQSRIQRTTNTSSSSACQPVVAASSLRILSFSRSPWSLPTGGPHVLEGAPPALRRHDGSTVGSGAAGPFADWERPFEMLSARTHLWASDRRIRPPRSGKQEALVARRDSRSCAPCGSATSRADPSGLRRVRPLKRTTRPDRSSTTARPPRPRGCRRR